MDSDNYKDITSINTVLREIELFEKELLIKRDEIDPSERKKILVKLAKLEKRLVVLSKQA